MMTNTASAKDTKLREITRYGVLPATVSLQIREPGSALTHFAGLILMSIGAGPLLMRAKQSGSGFTLVGMIVFVVSCCLLYAASTTYHTVVLDEKKTTVFRKLDHMSISIMIAGTYTPICLTALRGKAGYILLALVWTLALGGVLLKLFWVTCPKWLSSAVYLMMGWLCVFAFPLLEKMLSAEAFAWLAGGGIFYTVGAIIYAMHPKKFDSRHIYFGSHEIFHVFIMLGTFCHYMLMYRFLALVA
jgi:hemolysin III